jgi:hypothetical protein
MPFEKDSESIFFVCCILFFTQKNKPDLSEGLV